MLLAGRSLSPLLSFLFPAGTHSLTHSHKAGADIHVHTPLACIHLPAKYPFDVTKTTILCKRFINRPQCESFCLPVCVSLYRPFLSSARLAAASASPRRGASSQFLHLDSARHSSPVKRHLLAPIEYTKWERNSLSLSHTQYPAIICT